MLATFLLKSSLFAKQKFFCRQSANTALADELERRLDELANERIAIGNQLQQLRNAINQQAPVLGIPHLPTATVNKKFERSFTRDFLFYHIYLFTESAKVFRRLLLVVFYCSIFLSRRLKFIHLSFGRNFASLPNVCVCNRATAFLLAIYAHMHDRGDKRSYSTSDAYSSLHTLK